MSSLRNAIQRRNHKERAQPLERQRLGLLEKRKDYLLRAKDYKSKQTRLKLLAEKATSRNPDEFYYSMINSRTKGGLPVAGPRNEALSVEAAKLLKTQDIGYLRMKHGAERKAIERLEEETAFKSMENISSSSRGRGNNKHIVFVDTKEEAMKFDPMLHFGTHSELLDKAYNRLRIEQLSSMEIPEVDGKGSTAKLRELSTRVKRAEQLEKVETELDLQRQRMGKGRMIRKNKWAQERKR